MGQRRIHTQGGALDLSVLGQPQTTPMSMLSHPALMSNVGIHNVLQGVHSPLHPNTLRSTGGDLKGDLKHLAYHHLHSGKRGHELMDDIYHSGRQLLGVGLYAQPHGGDLLDSIYHTGRHLIDRGHDGKPLVDMLLHHSGRQGGSGLSAEPMGGSILDTLGNKLGDRAIDMALSHMFGGQIPAPPSRSPITDPSLVGGKMRRMRGGNELTGCGKTPFFAGLPRPSASQVAKQTAGFNALDKGLEAFEGKLIGGGIERSEDPVGFHLEQRRKHITRKKGNKLVEKPLALLSAQPQAKHEVKRQEEHLEKALLNENPKGYTRERVEHLKREHNEPITPHDPHEQELLDEFANMNDGTGMKKSRKGRFVKGSAEAKAYMASIRKKK